MSKRRELPERIICDCVTESRGRTHFAVEDDIAIAVNLGAVKCSELQAEIDRLRAELATWKEIAGNAGKAEIHARDETDRLRAENAKLKSENIRQETLLQDANNDLHNLRVEVHEANAAYDAQVREFNRVANAVSALRKELMDQSANAGGDSG